MEEQRSEIMEIKHWADTSALLHQPLLDTKVKIAISQITLQELEHIKNSDKENQQTKFKAREAVRQILTSNMFDVIMTDNRKIDKMLKKYPFLSNINDHRILCAAEIYAVENNRDIIFLTSDALQYLSAVYMPHLSAVYPMGTEMAEKYECEWAGWGKYYPSEQEMALLYTDPKMNVLKCKTNEYAEIYEGHELKDLLFWNGHEYRPLRYKELRNDFLNQTIRPLNTEQKMAFDLLQNPEIPVKLFTGVPGSGKDYLMFLHAWDLVQKGKKDKIIFIRNLVPFKDAPEIGFLEGSLQRKIEWGLGPIASVLGEEGLKQAQERGEIEAVNLGFIRGMSWDNVILYVSEGQNITGGGYKLLISRCGKGSELWINGDTLQTDGKKFESNNGIERLLSSLSGNKLFGTVKMLKTERSEIAELASII